MLKRVRHYFFLLIPGAILAGCNSQQEIALPNTYINAGANIWQLESWDDRQWALADYQGNVSVFNPTTESHVWKHQENAFVFDLKTADLDGNGSMEMAFVTAEGDLRVLDHQGNELWSFSSPLALFNVVIGDFTGNENLEIACGGIDRFVYVFDASGKLLGKSEEMPRLVHRLAAGNLTGNGKEEILAIANRTQAYCLTFQNDSLVTAWEKPLKVPDHLINWENPRGSFFPFSIEISDLDGDGDMEIIMGDTFFNKQAVMVADHRAESIWISEGLEPFSHVDGAQTEFYSTAFVRAADIFPEYDGKEVISMAAGMFRIFTGDGQLIGAQNSKLGFTDLEIRNGDLMLASCPNGDEYMYHLPLNEAWQQSIEDLTFQGLIAEIQKNSQEIKQQVLNLKSMESPEQTYTLKNEIRIRKEDENSLDFYQQQQDWFHSRFPYDNIQLIQSAKAMQHEPPLDEKGEPWSMGRWRTDAINGTMSDEEILARAQWVEENRIPTMFTIGHSCMPFITLDMAEKILQTAPNYCIGFGSMEDEQIERIPRYFEHYMSDLADLCLQYGNKILMTKNKGVWWMSAPANPRAYQAMFTEGREEVTMAATEDSNSRTPEINLMARAGLWQAGLLHHNDVSIHADIFSFNRFHQWEYPRIGSPYLRLMVAHTVAGMTNLSTRIREIIMEEDSTYFNNIGQESTEIFYHLLGKGLVFSPTPEQAAIGYSKVGLVMHQPPHKWLVDAHNGHTPEKWKEDPELHQAFIPHIGSLWGMTNTPEHAFQAVAFNKKRQFGYQVPPTPYGLVAIVPEHAPLNEVKGVSEWWHTDGIDLWKEDGAKMTGQEAANVFRASLETAASDLAFRQAGESVYLQALKVSDENYRLYLVDPGWLDPANREVNVRIQLAGDFNVADMLSGESIVMEGKTFKTTVPAGLFKILEVTKSE